MEAVFGELPGFVRRSGVTPDDLAPPRDDGQRFISFKPIVFFHTHEPVELLLRVYHLGGCPWVYFPDASNYVSLGDDGSDPSLVAAFLKPAQAPAPFVGPGGKLYWEGRAEAMPPWLRPEDRQDASPPASSRRQRRAGNVSEAAGRDLATKFDLVPWTPQSHVVDFDSLRGLGLE